ncbi:MAG: galactose mutarotase [Hymenobacter sp.]|nr:MAG: galactose mutarotase [Hymenobacter sp.]
MSTATPFGTAPDGTEIQLFTLHNAHGMQATISTYGGTLTSLLVPDRHGQLGDVVLGFESLAGYLSPAFRKAQPYFGALIGRYGNRIAGGEFTLDGHSYQVSVNDGPNSLHGGQMGFDQKVWLAQPGTSVAGEILTLSYLSPDGEEGYPGNLRVTVVYTLTADNALRLDYRARTDQPTVLNLTNHSYFNLSLGAVPDVLTHEVMLAADQYTAVHPGGIPTGDLPPVAGTPFDFRQPHAIGARIAQVPGGYDHNWVLRTAAGKAHPAVSVHDPASGRTLEVVTSQPGVQFYTGNFLDGSLTGKNGVVYGPHAGFCLETQHFPDSPNHPDFPSIVLRPGQEFRAHTEYRFGVRK